MSRLTWAVLLLVACSHSLADDWPRWRGPDATGVVPAGREVPVALPANPDVVWKIPVGPGFAAPIVARGVVFYLDAQADKETVHAVDAATGRERWRATLDSTYRDFQSAPGPRCAPIADGERLYVQSCLGEFQCLNAADGALVWRTNFAKDFGAPVPAEAGDNLGGNRHGNSGPAIIEGDRIVVAVGSHQGASLVCFDKRNGKVLWKSQNDPPGHLGPIVATLAGVRQVVAFTAIACIGVDLKTGALLWRIPIETRYGRHAMTPIVTDDMVIVGSNGVGLLGIRVSKSGGGLAAQRAWNLPSLLIDFSSPVLLDGRVYGLGPANSLFCVDARSGALLWKRDRFFSGLVGTDYASFLGMGKHLLVLTDGGTLLLLRPDARDCVEVGRATVCGRNWCNPAYADRCLYLRDGQELKCLRLMK